MLTGIYFTSVTIVLFRDLCSPEPFHVFVSWIAFMLCSTFFYCNLTNKLFTVKIIMTLKGEGQEKSMLISTTLTLVYTLLAS